MNLYDFSFKTGSSFSELYSPNDDTCREDSFFGTLAFTSPQITGLYQTRLSCNGQTLVEQKGVVSQQGFNKVYLNSGDYYFQSGVTYKKASFDEDFEDPRGESSYFYNIRDDAREAAMGTGNSRVLRQSSLVTSIEQKFPELTYYDFDYFSNGQKIYAGIDIGNGSYRIHSLFILGGGWTYIFQYFDDHSGKIFAIPKNSGLQNITGVNADIYGIKFVPETVFSYINGASSHKKNWLELSTGVTMIRTGVQASFFDPASSTQSIRL